MLGRHVTLFRLLGFEVKLDLSWIFLAVLVTWTLAAGYFPSAHPGLGAPAYWSMAVVGAAGLFASIILHELSHSVVARGYGMQISGITLFIFGGVAEMREEPPSARAEFFMAIAGPIASLVLAGLFSLAAAMAGAETPFGIVLGYLALINLILAVFNMVPAFPLDGGRALRAVLWGWRGDMRWATRITAAMGFGFGLFLMALGLMSLLGGSVIGGLWWGLIGLFLAGAARASAAQLEARATLSHERVAARMTRDPVTVPPDMELPEFARLALAHGHRLYPVMTEDGRLLGQIETKALAAVERDRWPGKTVRDAMTRAEDMPLISPDATLADAMGLMTRTGRSRLVVAEDGPSPRLAGILVLRDIMRVLELRAELHVPEEAAR